MPVWSLALLGAGLLSCEDNESVPAAWDPSIQAVTVPAILADNAPEPYLIQVEINRPADPAEANGLQVRLELSGPGLSVPAVWILKDDGGQPLSAGEAGVLQDAASSGDNIPGDLVFTAQGLVDVASALGVDFSTTPGSYQLLTVLSRDGAEQDRHSRSLAVGHNGAPLVQGAQLPPSLASGDSLTASVQVADPDGPEDLQSVWLALGSQPDRRWLLPALDDSVYSRRLGPEVGARVNGATGFRLGATDRFGQETWSDVNMNVENLPPQVDGQDLRVWQRVAGELQPLDFTDTLRLVIPLPGETREVVFRASPRDDQGPDDIRSVQLVNSVLSTQPILLLDNGAGADPVAADGEYSARVLVPSQAVPPVGQQLELTVEPWLDQTAAVLDLPLALIPERTNLAPTVDAVFAPDTVYSGDHLHLEAEFGDPDGASDITGAWVRFVPTGERWFMQRSGNRWEADLPAELVSFRASASYGFRVVVSDLFSAMDSTEVPVYLENGAPALDESALAFYRVIDGNGHLLAGEDTVRFEIPAPQEFNHFVFTLPVTEDQGLAELDRVEWTIEPLDHSSRTSRFMYDDGGANALSADQVAGDGVFTGALSIEGMDYTNLIYFVDFTASDQLGNEAEPIQRIFKLVDEESPGPIRPPAGRPIRFTLPRHPAMTAFGGAR